MARTTVEDCIQHTPNQYELVMGTASRAKKLRKGEVSELASIEDKEIVTALREIAQGKHTIDLEAEIVQSLNEDYEITSGAENVAAIPPADQSEPEPAG